MDQDWGGKSNVEGKKWWGGEPVETQKPRKRLKNQGGQRYIIQGEKNIQQGSKFSSTGKTGKEKKATKETDLKNRFKKKKRRARAEDSGKIRESGEGGGVSTKKKDTTGGKLGRASFNGLRRQDRGDRKRLPKIEFLGVIVGRGACC